MTELSLIAKVTLVLLVSLVTVRLARRASASCRSLILTSTFSVLLALPIVAALSPVAIGVPVLPAVPALSTSTPPSAPVHAETATRVQHEPQPSLNPRARTGRAWLAFWLRTAWLLGSIALLVPVARTVARARRIRSHATRWARGKALTRTLARDAGVSRSIDTLLRDDARAPLTLGLIHPTIVLPVEAQGWSDGDLRRALVHEIEHIRRNDWCVHLLARVACAIYWFHPLVWTAWRRLRLESERACDDGVLRCAEGAAYAEQLLILARRLAASSATGLFMAGRTDLATRISAVLDSSQRRNRPGLRSKIATIAAAIVMLVAIAPVQATRASAHDAGAESRQANARLVGNLFDPFGGAVEHLKLYLERVAGPESYQGQTDEVGHFVFETLHPGTYTLSAPMDFVPPTTIVIAPGELVQRDIQMEIDTLTDAFTVCAECPAEIDTYVPPDSLVAEFQRDRAASWNQPVRGPEPVGGWEFYWSRLPEYPPALKDARLEGTVVVEGRIGTDGSASGLRVVSDVHPALASAALEAVQAERWEPGRVRGVAVEVPLRMTIDYILHARAAPQPIE
jgi:TonB family protein